MEGATIQSDAERKFWASPELLETLFSWLDLEAAFNLAQVVDKKSLQIGGITSKVWNKLIRSNCPVDVGGRLFGGFLYDRDSFYTRYHGLKLQEARRAMKKLATILKLMEQPKDLLLDFLDVICEGLPPLTHVVNQLQIVCPRHLQPHNVSTAGFLLLEEVEGVLGSSKQRIHSMEMAYLNEPTILAISSRMTRQQDPVTSIRIKYRVDIETEKGARAFHTLMSGQIEQGDTFPLWVKGSLGAGGWEAVAKALQLQPGLVHSISTSNRGLAEGKKDDIKNIWDTAGLEGFVLYQTSSDMDWDWGYHVTKPDDDWERLEQILYMSEAEFAAKIKEAQEEEEREEEEGDPETGEEDE